MDLKHFGDSYDVVKKSLLQWLSVFGPWAVHPMFTHAVTDQDAAAFSKFLGVKLVSTEVLVANSDRRAYLAACGDCRSIFLDPDTGVRLRPRGPKDSMKYIYSDELLKIAAARPQGLVLTFDQSLARGSEPAQVRAKLDDFLARGLNGFAYVSHASFLVLGQSDALVAQARDRLLAASGLPASRVAIATAPNKGLQPAATGMIMSRGV